MKKFKDFILESTDTDDRGEMTSDRYLKVRRFEFKFNGVIDKNGFVKNLSDDLLKIKEKLGIEINFNPNDVVYNYFDHQYNTSHGKIMKGSSAEVKLDTRDLKLKDLWAVQEILERVRYFSVSFEK